ncbi:MAG: 3-phosphoshikimate 1-carboxyvinyltransferase [Treponema sp.]|nr:3-phosphoshikimate 1-carboxyvinyltransferase [Treponema sp.]
MRARISPHVFSGTIRIPGSKSHTIRQLLIASLADGVSEIMHPLDSLDTQACITACRAFGAVITEHRNDGKLVSFTVHGNNRFKKGVQKGVSHLFEDGSQKGVSHLFEIDVGNSGTTLYLAMAAAGLDDKPYTFTGDAQIQRRSAAPLLEALSGLGIRAESVQGNGCAPIVIQGPWDSGKVNLPCPTSQYLSALLLTAPLAPAGTITEITVPLLNERPYIEMTLSYLDAHGIPWEAASSAKPAAASQKPFYSYFVIPGGAAWKPFSAAVPGDFSSAAFPACAAVISGGSVTILGLDPNDTQGDKFFLEILTRMGCSVSWGVGGEESQMSNSTVGHRLTVSRAGPLRGGNTFDLNDTPDLLPVIAVTAAFAEGDTALVNVAHARIKETDRIAVMAAELAKLGVRCTELPDGLIVHGNAAGNGKAAISGGVIDGHGDHRIVMAFAAAALAAQAPIDIDGAESADVTYPGFLELLNYNF